MLRREAGQSSSGRRKVRRKRPPSTTSIAAILGAQGAEDSRRAARGYATRTPTEIGQTTPTSSRGQRAKAKALKASSSRRKHPTRAKQAARKYSRSLKREQHEAKVARQIRAQEKQFQELISGRESAAEQFAERNERRARQGKERWETEDDPGIVERLVEGGVVGLIDEDASAEARKFIYGTKDPSVGQIALTVAPGALGVVGKAAKAVRGAKAAEDAATLGTRARKLEGAAKRAAKGKPAKKRRVVRSTRESRQAIGRLRKGTRARYSKSGRSNRRTRRAQGLAAIGAASPPAAMIAGGTVETTGKALAGDIREGKPLRTLKTTARTAAALPAAVVGDVIDVATGNWEDVAKSQLDYWEKMGKVASGAPGAEKIVQQDLGLVPLATGGLTALGLAKAAGGVGLPVRPRRARKVRRLADTAQNAPTARKRRAAKAELEREVGESFADKHRNRKREAERAAVTGELREGQFARETRLGRRGSLVKLVGKLDRKSVNEDVSFADTIQLLGRRGLMVDDPDLVRGKLSEYRKNLAKPSREIDPDEVTTRAVLDALLDTPGALERVLADKDMHRAVDGFERLQRGRSVERHEQRAGREGAQERTDPLDEVPRLLHVARSEDIRTPSEEIPFELRGKTKVKPRRGQDAAKAIREEAKNLERQADNLEGRAARQRRAAEAEGRAGKREVRAREQNRTKPRPREIIVSSVRIGDEIRLDNGRYQTVTRVKKGNGKVVVGGPWGTEMFNDAGAVVTVRRADRRRSTTKARVRSARNRERLEERAAILERRAALIRELAVELRAVTDRFKRAEKLEIAAAAFQREGKSPEAEKLRAEAKALRAEGNRMQEELRAEFVERVESRIESLGLREPIYFRESDVSDRGGLNVQQDFPGAKAGKKERHRTGRLEEEGRIDESGLTLIENVYRTRAVMAQNEAALDFLSDHLFVPDEDALGRMASAEKFGPAIEGIAREDAMRGVFLTGPEWRKLAREGKVPPGHVLIPVQEFSAAMQRGDLDAADDMLIHSLKRETQEARWAAKAGPKGTRKTYGAVPESALREFRAQAEPLGSVMRKVRAISRLQTGLMLATSVPWFAFQLVASPLVMAARHPNPAAWGRAAVHAARVWRKASERERAGFRAHFGGTSADILTLGDVHTAMRAETVREMSDGLRLAFRSPVGRAVHSVGRSVKRGGPLIRANRRYEAGLRVFGAFLEMDRLAGLNRKGDPRPMARVKKFGESAAGLTDSVHRHMEAMKGLKPEEWPRFYLDRPKHMRELENAVNDAQGNWNALTKFERQLSSVLIFYPFVRFSLRWLFYAFPKNNPIKAAVALNLAQQNADELQELIGGNPDFFTKWGTVVTHVDGMPNLGLDLARAGPGGNVIVESLAGENLDLSTALRPVQPAIGILANALDGKDQFGNVIEEASFLELVARGGVSLSPLTRPLRQDIGPERSEISELFEAIENRGSPISRKAEAVVPDPVANLASEREIVRLGKLLDRASRSPDNSEIAKASGEEVRKLARRKRVAEQAQQEIDAMMRQYGVETKAEQRREEEEVSNRFSSYYERTREPSSSGSGWYGSGLFSGGSNPYTQAENPYGKSADNPYGGEGWYGEGDGLSGRWYGGK